MCVKTSVALRIFTSNNSSSKKYTALGIIWLLYSWNAGHVSPYPCNVILGNCRDLNLGPTLLGGGSLHSVVTMRQQSSSLQIHIASPSLLFWHVDCKDFCKYDISVTINTSILRKKSYKISGNVCSIFCRRNSHDTETVWITSNNILLVCITPLNNLNINMNHHASVSTLDEFLIYAEFTNVFTEVLW